MPLPIDASKPELIEERQKLIEVHAHLSEGAQEVYDKYSPDEASPEGKKVPDAEWKGYKDITRQIEMNNNRQDELSKAIRNITELELITSSGDNRLKNFKQTFELYTDKKAPISQDLQDQFFVQGPENCDWSETKMMSLNAALTRDGVDKTDDPAETHSSGAAAIPEEHQSVLVEMLLSHGGVMNLASVLSTATGRNMPVPQVDATTQKGARLKEAIPAGFLDTPDLGDVTLKDWIYTSKTAQVTHQMVRDASFNVLEWIRGALVVRIARIMSDEFTKGTRSDGPNGFTDQVKDGVVSSASGSYKWGELLDLYGSVDAAYLSGSPGHGVGNGGSIGYAANRGTIVNLMQLADTQQRPLFTSDVHSMGELRLFGYSLRQVYEMDGIAAGKVPFMFGNFGYFVVRVVEDTRVMRFDDYQFASAGKIAFLAFAEADARWVQPLDANDKITCVQGLKLKA